MDHDLMPHVYVVPSTHFLCTVYVNFNMTQPIKQNHVDVSKISQYTPIYVCMCTA